MLLTKHCLVLLLLLATARVSCAQFSPPITVAQIPPPGINGRLAMLTDAFTADSCATGGGTKRLLCVDTGSAWVPFDSPAGSGNTWGAIGGTLSNQTDLQTVLDGKAAGSHQHGAADVVSGIFSVDRIPDLSESKVTGLVSDLAGKAASSHSHAESDITNLVSDLAAKAAATHGHAQADVTGLVSDLAGKVSTSVTVNGHALSSNVTVTAADVGLGNVTNDAQVKASEKGAANGVATLNASALVVENPANATATPTGSKIPIAAAGGTLNDGWLSTTWAKTSTPGTSGTAPNWASQVLNIPMAATASVTAGLLSKTDYDAFNGKPSLVGSGTAGAGPSKVGDAATAARSNHDHRSVSAISWYFPGTPGTGVQNLTLVLPEGIVNPAITDMRVTVNTTSASSSTFNIQRCTANCTGTSPTFADIYSTVLTLNANTRTVAKGSAPNQNVSGLAAGDQFKASLVTIGASLADVTVTMTVKYDTTS